jgi:hypothetical protein
VDLRGYKQWEKRQDRFCGKFLEKSCGKTEIPVVERREM